MQDFDVAGGSGRTRIGAAIATANVNLKPFSYPELRGRTVRLRGVPIALSQKEFALMRARPEERVRARLALTVAR